MTALTELLGCKYPIIQGAMGVISNPEFVAAVSEAGGFGILASAFTADVEKFRNEVRATRKLTDKPFGMNLHAMNPLAQQFAEILVEEGVKTVTLSGGSPKALLPILHEAGIKAIAVVPSVNVACKAEALGIDAVVAEGTESGGMQGFKGVSTLVLVPAVVDAVKIPVIAAGGIGDSRGFRAAMALGACGVQVGTRFIASHECIAHSNFKNAIVDLKETGTDLVNLGRFQVRSIHTPLVEKMIADPVSTQAALKDKGLEESWVSGDLEAGFLPAGEVSALVKSVLPVKEIIAEMVK